MSRLSPHFRVFYRCAAFVALLAMFVPVVTGLVHHPVAAQTMTMPGMSMSGMMMTGQPCPMQQGKGGSDKPHKAPICPICQSMHLLAGGYVPPAPVALAVIAPQSATPVFALPIFRLAFVASPQARPRAPPFSA